MNINEIQQQLFQFIKTKLPAETSVADEIGKLLNISSDSAYRRMRGEKQITFEELYLLASTYRISLDQLMNINTGSFMFQGNLLNPKTHRYDAYLTGMMHNMAYFNSFKKKEFYYLCKDTPVFHWFTNRDIAAFKYFFWMGTLIYFPEFRNRKVSLDGYPDELFEMGKKISDFYQQLDTYELWNIESWNSTLHQIEYYLDNDMFKSDEDALRVYEGVEKILDHLEEQAKRGYKFNINDPEKKPLGKYFMYFNEIVILDNSMGLVLDNSKIAVLPHTAINYLVTRDIAYCENFYNYVQNLIKRSTLISEVSEKERSRYFRRMHERIDKRKVSLKV
ncbi:MAG TPA: helix-turn-helix domain-containing protein [Chitinophagaceae bacterium]|nr:helix-turn-helix domain-containing protein [Chitinophagaceae bacterium]